MTRDKEDFAALYASFWESGVHHAGLVIISSKSIAPGDIGGALHALGRLLEEEEDLSDQMVFLRAAGRTP